jgi:hypothetical protein
MTTPTAVRPAPGGATVAPLGSPERSRTYYDEQGRLHTANKPVPVDKFGRLTSVEFVCRRCDIDDEWYPTAQIPKGQAPTCGKCRRAMQPVPVKDAPWPWRETLAMVERPLRPVWGLGAVAAAGAGVADGSTSALLFLAGAPVVGELARRITARWRIRRELDRVAETGRRVGYTAAAATGWLAVPAAFGVDSPVAAAVTWGSLAAAWVIPAGGWWRRERDARNAPKSEPVVVADAEPVGPLEDAGEKYVRLVWAARLAAKQGVQVIDPDTGQPVTAEQAGRLPGTFLEDWRRIEGGWSATVVGPVGAYESDKFSAAVKNIAAAYRMHRSMVTVMPDPEDENRAIVMAQKVSPLKDTVRWAGPDSIDAVRGQAVVGRYVDGTPLLYELNRPGWGCPHDFLCGTTGAGKSETLSGLLVVDRWASHIGADGVRRGIVCDLLIDPQQGQSYEPFMDDLAAPVATSLEEAMMLAEAVRAEMFRRNAYLSKKGWRDTDGVLHRAEWLDKRGKVRYGRKYWDPLIDGPILTLNIDEAHEYLKHKPFAEIIASNARMYRKCGIRIRVATHTPLLSDLGGSMALRDMLTGGFVWCGRVANALSGPTAFNGRLPVDPRSIPSIPGAGFTLGQLASKPMMSRFMWEEDYYELVRDVDDNPVGYPVELPAPTVEAFNAGTAGEFSKWFAALRAGEDWTPNAKIREQIVVAQRTEQRTKCVDAVLSVLAASAAPLDMNELDAALETAGTPFSTRAVRDALAKLRERGLVFSVKGRHELTPQARAERDESAAEEQEQLALDAEGGEW